MKEITTGQDSFLDIVANLVGILIILIVVVGAQAKVAWKPAVVEEDRSAEKAQLLSAVDDARQRAVTLATDNALLESQIQVEQTATISLDQARHEMLVQIEIVDRQLAAKKNQMKEKLSAEQQQQLELASEESRSLRQLEELNQAINAVSSIPETQKDIIKHFPNPIAKTVFTEEVHFQIRGGKIVYVPLEELIGRMKAEVKSKAALIQQQPRVVSTVGPLQNFQLQYELIGEVIGQPGPNGGMIERTMIQFNGFQLLPSSDDLGVPTAQAVRESGPISEFQSVLQRMPSSKTTVSLWVYPDSFTEYNEIKNWLYARGYQVACWPLDADKKISGGPSGFRTSAQ